MNKFGNKVKENIDTYLNIDTYVNAINKTAIISKIDRRDIDKLYSIFMICSSVFAIFFLLIQIKQYTNRSIYLADNYKYVLNIITVFFFITFGLQIIKAPRMSYRITHIVQMIAIVIFHVLYKKHYGTELNRFIYALIGSSIFISSIVINWMRLSYTEISLSQLITGSFIFVIVLGSLILYLPVSARDGARITYLDALFTSTSAVCVTGLSVFDVGSTLSFFGQVILIMLIQIGGLGIMSISSILVLFVHGRGSVRDRARKLELFETGNRDVLIGTIKVIFTATFVIEAIGAILLYQSFTDLHGFDRVFSSIFHSISAFCNAGFSLYNTGLHYYVRDYNVSLTVSGLIIFGGLGYPVMFSLIRLLEFKLFRMQKKYNSYRVRFNSQTRIVLFTTIALLIVGTLFIYFNESQGSLSGFDFKEKLLISFFQSVTTRTAGFETFAFSSFTPLTIGFSMLLMFIGASPSGTGGGIKTTTLYVFMASVITTLKGRDTIIVANRKIANTNISKSVAVVSLALAAWFVSAVLIYYFEAGKVAMMAIMFECSSALATVGLTLGLTMQLGSISRCVLIALMFIGRVGFLTLFMSIGSTSEDKYTLVEVPTDSIIIG